MNVTLATSAPSAASSSVDDPALAAALKMTVIKVEGCIAKIGSFEFDLNALQMVSSVQKKEISPYRIVLQVGGCETQLAYPTEGERDHDYADITEVWRKFKNSQVKFESICLMGEIHRVEDIIFVEKSRSIRLTIQKKNSPPREISYDSELHLEKDYAALQKVMRVINPVIMHPEQSFT